MLKHFGYIRATIYSIGLVCQVNLVCQGGWNSVVGALCLVLTMSAAILRLRDVRKLAAEAAAHPEPTEPQAPVQYGYPLSPAEPTPTTIVSQPGGPLIHPLKPGLMGAQTFVPPNPPAAVANPAPMAAPQPTYVPTAVGPTDSTGLNIALGMLAGAVLSEALHGPAKAATPPSPAIEEQQGMALPPIPAAAVEDAPAPAHDEPAPGVALAPITAAEVENERAAYSIDNLPDDLAQSVLDAKVPDDLEPEVEAADTAMPAAEQSTIAATYWDQPARDEVEPDPEPADEGPGVALAPISAAEVETRMPDPEPVYEAPAPTYDAPTYDAPSDTSAWTD